LAKYRNDTNKLLVLHPTGLIGVATFPLYYYSLRKYLGMKRFYFKAPLSFFISIITLNIAVIILGERSTGIYYDS